MDVFRSPEDYEVFLSILRAACTRHQLDVHSYVFMTTHIHLLVTPRTACALSKAMQLLGPRYVQRHFNWRYTRTGALFEGRYRPFPIDAERYFFNCMRYVELNPVRAGLVARPEDYPWSSHRANGMGMPDSLIVPHPLYRGFGSSPEDRQRSWRQFCAEAVPDRELAAIRHAVHCGGTLGEAMGESAEILGKIESPDAADRHDPDAAQT